MAYFGVTVGAGFSSGQEPLQYYAAYGTWGLVGAALIVVILPLTALVILQYGSYFKATSHSVVFNKISGRYMGRFLDYSLSISQFCIGFVMLAGAGANLKQQFGLPLWVGSALMCVLVLITGLLDVDRVSALLGYITPLMVVLIIVAIVYGLATVDADWATASATAQETVPQPLPNWLFATLNYVGLCMFSGISMAILIGGSSWNTKAAGWGGFAGGMLFAVLLIALTVTFILQIDLVHDSDLPILLLLNQINPAIGVIASIATYGMIYSTTLGVIYSLSKRITVRAPQRYVHVLVIITAASFGLSFFEFKMLINKVYPIMGWLGVLIIVVLLVTWLLKGREKIGQEVLRRDKIRVLILKMVDPKTRLRKRELAELNRTVQESSVSEQLAVEGVAADAVFELGQSDDDRDINEEKLIDHWVEQSEQHGLELSVLGAEDSGDGADESAADAADEGAKSAGGEGAAGATDEANSDGNNKD